jgi:group I intron endonuclease
METGVIYKIVNRVNGKVYIGQTIDFKRRIINHFSKLRQDKHRNSHLQGSFNKYGEEVFDMVVVDKDIPVEDLSRVEQYYIMDLFNSYYEGYNQTKGDLSFLYKRGENNNTVTLTKNDCMNIYYTYHTSDIYQRSLADEYNVGRALVRKIVNHEHWSTRNMPKFCRLKKGKNKGGFNSGGCLYTKHECLEVYKYWKDNKCPKSEVAKHFPMNYATVLEILNHTHWSTKNMPAFCREDDIPNELKNNVGKYSKKKCLEVYYLYANSRLSQIEVSKRTGVKKNTVSKIIHYNHWSTENMPLDERVKGFKNKDRSASRGDKTDRKKCLEAYIYYYQNDITFIEASKDFPFGRSTMSKIAKHKHWSTKNMPEICRFKEKVREGIKQVGEYPKDLCIKAYKVYENNDFTKKKVAKRFGIHYRVFQDVTNHKHPSTRDLTKKEIMNME